jgi:hypothetical protein
MWLGRAVLVVAVLVGAAGCRDGGDIRLPDGVIREDNTVPQLGDHIHEAFGIYVCDHFLDPVPAFESRLGIHTHGDGVIHIHPFQPEATGAKARLLLFLDGAGIDVSANGQSITVLGTTYAAGDDCKGARVNALTVTWSEDVQERTVRRIDDIGLDDDGASITLAFVPEGANVPQPPSTANLRQLGAAGPN